MKKIKTLFLALAATIVSQDFKAQELELVPMAGYVWGSTYYGYDGRIYFNGGLTYGGMLNFKPNKNVEIGLSVLNQQSSADLHSYTLNSKDENGIPAGIIYYQLSLVRNYQLKNPKVTPFMGLDIGAAELYKSNEKNINEFRFAMGFKAGLKFQITEKINIRVQPQLEMPIAGIGLGFGIGTGGASAGAYTTSNMIQFGVIGGVGLTLKGKPKETVPVQP